MNKKTQTLIGFISGIVLPVLVIILTYKVKFHHIEMTKFLMHIFRFNIISQFLQLAAIPNLLLFFVFMWVKRPYASRGVIAATFIIVIAVLVFSYVL